MSAAADDESEVERLRRELAELRAQLLQAQSRTLPKEDATVCETLFVGFFNNTI